MSCNKCGPLKVCSCSCPPAPCSTAVTYFPTSAPANNTTSFVPIPLVGDTGTASISVNENLTIKGVGLLKTNVTEAGNTNNLEVSLTGSTAGVQQKLVSQSGVPPIWVDDNGSGAGSGGVNCTQAEQAISIGVTTGLNPCPTISINRPCSSGAVTPLNLPKSLKRIATEISTCGDELVLYNCDETVLDRAYLGRRTRFVSTAPIIGAVNGTVQPVVITGTVATLAQLDSVNNVADFLAYIESSTQILILGQGIHYFPTGHGIATTGKYLSVSRTTAGAFVDPTVAFTSTGLVQNAVWAFSSTCLIVDLQEAQYPNPCNTMTITAHGFGTLPANGILPIGDNGTTWVKAIADGVGPTAQLIVTEILDANTVRVANPGMNNVVGHGLTLRKDYALSQSVAGAIVLASTITSGVKQKLLTATATDCVYIC